MNRTITSTKRWRALVFVLVAPGYVSFASSRMDQHLKLGHQSLAAKDYSSAAVAFESADNAASGASWLARIGLARTYIAMGRYHEALTQGRQALNLSADTRQQAESHFEIGRT